MKAEAVSVGGLAAISFQTHKLRPFGRGVCQGVKESRLILIERGYRDRGRLPPVLLFGGRKDPCEVARYGPPIHF
jgi:hypothetical protein